MVKHIVMFQFREQISPDERQQTGWEVKTRTEALVDIIPGIQSLQVQLVPVGTSTMISCWKEYLTVRKA